MTLLYCIFNVFSKTFWGKSVGMGKVKYLSFSLLCPHVHLKSPSLFIRLDEFFLEKNIIDFHFLARLDDKDLIVFFNSLLK